MSKVLMYNGVFVLPDDFDGGQADAFRELANYLENEETQNADDYEITEAMDESWGELWGLLKIEYNDGFRSMRCSVVAERDLSQFEDDN